MSDKPLKSDQRSYSLPRETPMPKYEYQSPVMSSGGQVYKDPAEVERDRSKAASSRSAISLKNFALSA